MPSDARDPPDDPHYRMLEDVALADCAFEAWGLTPAELCLASARAVIETMVNPATVGSSWRHHIERRGGDLADLLFDWLSEIVFLKDAEGVVFHEATVDVTRTGEGAWLLRGHLTGEPINPARHELRADVKAVTKHLYDVVETNGRWAARVVLDI
jgi:SHS2 domain-containing protein